MHKWHDKAIDRQTREFNNMNDTRGKLYMYEKQYCNFENIDDERRDELDLIIEFQKDRYEKKKKKYMVNEKLDFYNDIMLFLTHERNLSIDEKLYILIAACDNELYTYHHFKEADIIKAQEVKTNPDLESIRKEQLSKYASEVREELGFYDSKLVKYERIYFNKFINIFNNDDIKRKILGD